MILRPLLVAALALLLGGCNGWVAETRLVPVAERDPVGLSGEYLADEDRLTITEGEAGLYLVNEVGTGGRPAQVAFDLLRDEQSDREVEGSPPDRSYLMEAPFESEDGKTGYIYHIVIIGGSDDGQSGSFAHFRVLCSKAAQALAARAEDGMCVFNDYARLRAAALDALAWYDERRMEVEIISYARVSEVDATGLDGL
jgi:hypothetical protein